MEELIQRAGLPIFVQCILLIYNELFLLVMIAAMLIGIRQDRDHNFIKKISVPHTKEIVIFFVAFFVYNAADIVLILLEGIREPYAYWGVRIFILIYYSAGAFQTWYILQAIKEHLAKQLKDERISRVITIVQCFQIPTMILLVVTPFTDAIYRITEDNYYERSWGYFIWTAVSAVSFLVLVILVIRYYRNLDRFFREILAAGAALVIVGFLIEFSGDYAVDINNITVTLASFFSFFIYEKNKAIYAVDNAIELEKSETRLMLSQIKPHFLYNILTSILYYCERDIKMTKEALLHFSKYLRGNVDSISKGDIISFEKELDLVKEYIYLERLGFEDDILVEYDIKDGGFCLPSLTLQPIVENAVRHGIKKNRSHRGTVKISSHREGGFHVVEIIDDGAGFEPEMVDLLDDSHVGIRNVRKRLMTECHGELIIESTPGQGSVAKLLIPVGGVADSEKYNRV